MNEFEADQPMEKKCPQCGAPLPSGVLAGLCPACLFKQGATADTAQPPEAAPFQPPSVEEVARLFPQLEILAFIGKGGMGAVYQARQPGLDRFVALKILPPQTASGPGFVERFNREARALAKLAHPNIVAVHEFGQVNGLPFFLMEFVDGLNLRQLERAGKLSPREALQIVPQICEALQFAHDEGIVHRDIKPENILLDKKGRVKIADFGIAKILGREAEPSLTETQGAIGTPHYMAPEQVENPTTVDHRADIFSLGVVFYEMLTGELPLGRFAPPSSGKVEVDVRLDDVVLRALEKDPERRYQHVSQVKTAVDTIAGSAAPPPPPPAVDATALAQEILARDYPLDIGHCLRRGWALVRGNFWPIVGISALIWVLLALAQSAGVVITSNHDRTNGGGSILGLLVSGPLMGGLYFYFLQRMRGQPVTVETAFAGFSNRFLHLFLGSFVSLLLTVLGFFCLILPGIYLWIAWTFTLPLIMDKRLDFWSAMELSRKMVNRHWWKFFGFVLILGLLHVAGFLVFCLGFFIAAPIAMASLMYAYEDIFGASGHVTAPPAAGVGPSGTAVLPGSLGTTPRGGGGWSPVKLGLGAVGLGIGLMVAVSLFVRARHERQMAWRAQADAVEKGRATELGEDAGAAPHLVFGPVIERELQPRLAGTNQFLDLDTEQLLTPSPAISDVLLASKLSDDDNRLWQALDIPGDSRRFQYISWLRESGADLMFAGDGKIIGFDGVFPIAHGSTATNWDDWDGLTPEQVYAAVEVVEWRRRATEAQLRGLPPPPPPEPGGNYNSAAQLDSREPGGPIVNLLARDQSVTWFFKTREGGAGVLQLGDFSDQPGIAKIRYKLVKTSNAAETVVLEGGRRVSRQSLSERLEAASMMNNMLAKDKALAAVATDSAKAGEIETAQAALRQIADFLKRNKAALETVRQLTKRGLRKPALEIAREIDETATRDQALSELAQ